MKVLKVAAIALLCSQLGGCFFVFIPGSVVGKISDGITGAEGEHCVGREAVVGGRIRMPNGEVMTIKSLSGTSVRCNDSRYPIRAALAADSSQVAQQYPRRTSEEIGICRHFMRMTASGTPADLDIARRAIDASNITPRECADLVGPNFK